MTQIQSANPVKIQHMHDTNTNTSNAVETITRFQRDVREVGNISLPINCKVLKLFPVVAGHQFRYMSPDNGLFPIIT